MKNNKINRKLYKDWHAVTTGIWRIRDLFVNVYLVHDPSTNTWVLIDAGVSSSGKKIKATASELFWPDDHPTAILLTHGHFDHRGSLVKLAEQWNVPIFAHILEWPYLTGKSSYPPPDPSVGGGLMSLLSFLYPDKPIDVSSRLQALPPEGRVPGLPGWKYYHTPGHAPGHVSFFRESDRVLIAGDAFVTTRQESATDVLLQTRTIAGPPKYFTYNWESAKRSVRLLAGLEPSIVATGHGQPMQGSEMRASLHALADDFEENAVPPAGRYVAEPALVNADGVQFVPPAPRNKMIIVVSIALVAALAGWVAFRYRRSH